MSSSETPPWAQTLLAQITEQSQHVASLAGQLQHLQVQFASLSLTAPTLPEGLTPESLRLLSADPRLPDHLQPFVRLLEVFGSFTLTDDQNNLPRLHIPPSGRPFRTLLPLATLLPLNPPLPLARPGRGFFRGKAGPFMSPTPAGNLTLQLLPPMPAAASPTGLGPPVFRSPAPFPVSSSTKTLPRGFPPRPTAPRRAEPPGSAANAAMLPPSLISPPRSSSPPPAPPASLTDLTLWIAGLTYARNLFRTHSLNAPPTFPALILSSVRPCTLAVYAQALDKFLSWTTSNDASLPRHTSIVRATQLNFVSLAAPPRPTAARMFLAAATLAVKALGWEPFLPSSFWVAATGLQALAPGPRRTWFCIHWLEVLTPSEFPTLAQPYAILLISFVFLLRVSEARRLRSADLTANGLRLLPAKTHRAPIWRAASPFISEWLLFLRASLHGRRACSTDAPLALLHRAASAHTPETLTWHALRRGAAAMLHFLGLPLSDLCHWGRWSSPRTANSYIEPHAFLGLPASLHLLSPLGIPTSLSLDQLWPARLFGRPDTSSSAQPTSSDAGHVWPPASLVLPSSASVPEPPTSLLPSVPPNSAPATAPVDTHGPRPRAGNQRRAPTSPASNLRQSKPRNRALRKRKRAP